ncbi:hypothetical protein JW823_06255 [bacterium]|nr:hypothetical protein [candidate division CSSED10-310 bacterium]
MKLSDNYMPPYQYNGARSMIIMHDRYLREFLSVWYDARAEKLVLPNSDDYAYESLEKLLQHVLGAARGYMIWMCEKLRLPDPEINSVPQLDHIAEDAPAWLDHLVQQWRTPLAKVPEDAFGVEYESRWRVKYCIDAMLEHAVMHPIRHTFQLRHLMKRD